MRHALGRGKIIGFRLPGCVFLAMLSALWAPPLRGEAACGAARHVLAAEAAVEAIGRGQDQPAAVGAAAELERRLARIAAEAGPREASGVDGSGHPVAAYLLSRRALAAALREEGLPAARALLRDAAFARAKRDVDALLARDAFCARTPAAPGRAGEAAALSGGPGNGDGQHAAAARATALGARPPGAGRASHLRAGGNAELPAADLRAGLLIVLGLALLLLVLTAFDPARRGDERRVICRVAAELRIRGASQPAVVVELSRRSAKLRTEGRFAPGERGALSFAGITVPVRVGWVTPSFTGVNFQHGLDLSAEALARSRV